ncbi:MAG: hypothetical protein V3U92_05145 [Cellulophaga sp.]
MKNAFHVGLQIISLYILSIGIYELWFDIFNNSYNGVPPNRILIYVSNFGFVLASYLVAHETGKRPLYAPYIGYGVLWLVTAIKASYFNELVQNDFEQFSLAYYEELNEFAFPILKGIGIYIAPIVVLIHFALKATNKQKSFLLKIGKIGVNILFFSLVVAYVDFLNSFFGIPESFPISWSGLKLIFFVGLGTIGLVFLLGKGTLSGAWYYFKRGYYPIAVITVLFVGLYLMLLPSWDKLEANQLAIEKIEVIKYSMHLIAIVFFSLIAIGLVILLRRSSKKKPFNPLSDAWHPDHYDAEPLPELISALRANLQTGDFENIMKTVESGMHDLNVKKKKLERVLAKWKTVQGASHNNESTGWRANYYSKETLANYERIILDKIAYIEDTLVQCNTGLNDLIDKATKHKGFAKPIDIADFDGINTTPIENINKQIE